MSKKVLLASALSMCLAFSSQAQKVTMHMHRAQLGQVFSAIKSQTGLTVAYGNQAVNPERVVTVDANNEELADVLQRIFAGRDVAVEIGKQKIYLTKQAAVQQKTIKGTVVDRQGEPLVGATVTVQGANKATITNMDGEFTLAGVPSNATIVIAYIGFRNLEMSATASFKKVVMKEDTKLIEEVVVIGYASTKQKDVTGAVKSVDSGKFNSGAIANPEQLMQGKIAGVRIVNSSGEPGAGMDMMIRGAGSIRSGNTPLFVVDGVPLSNDAVTPGGTGGIGSSRAKNPLNFLNPSDIKSISVLKDASAAAIYGARGSNGVVIITTKKGANKQSISFDASLGMSTVANKIDLVSADRYAEMNPDYNYGANTDWQDELLRTAITQNYNLSMSNGNERGNYFVSLSSMEQEGIIKESGFKRMTARVNADQSFFDDKRLKVSVNMTVSQTKDTAVPTSDTAGATGELITHMLKANPTRPVYNEDGSIADFDTEGSYNPVYMLDFFDDQTKSTRILTSMEAKYRIIPGLEYQLKYAIDKSTAERGTTYYPNTTEIEENGAYYQQNYDTDNRLLEHYLTYNKQFGAHQVNALAGFSYQRFKRSGTTFGVTEFERSSVAPINNPGIAKNQTDILTTGFLEENELQSYFGRVNYNYKSKYMATASMRADGSTRFGENNKYGYFPSAALGWTLSNEDFMKGINWLDNLKMRMSWGQTGNQEVPNKVTAESYSISAGKGYYMDGTSLSNGISYTRAANDDLKWEVVTQFDLGVDFELFDGKFYGTLDYYNKVTTDAILLLPAIQPNFSSTWTNMDGEIVNSGFEFTVGSQIFDTNDFSWSVDFNGAFNSNEVKDLPLSEILSGALSGPGVSGETVNIYKNGYSAGSFYMYEFLGYDENGITQVSDEKKIFESALPTFTYGLNTYLRYKQFDLSLAFTGQTGGYLFNNTRTATDIMSHLPGSKNISTDTANSGQSINDALVISNYYLGKSDYFRLSNVRLGYTFKLPNFEYVNSVNVYASGQNLFTITDYTGYDPSVNTSKSVGGNSSMGVDYASYPSARTFMVGVSIKY